MKRPRVDSDCEIKQEESCKLVKNEAELGQKLSDLIKKKKKFASKMAKVILSFDQSKSESDESEIKQENKEVEDLLNEPRFFVQDIQRVILYALIGNNFRFFPRWCKILRPNQIKSITLVTINNLSELHYQNEAKMFKKFNEIFKNQANKEKTDSIKFISSHANGLRFYDEFKNVPLTRAQWLKLRDEPEFAEKRKQVEKKYLDLFKKMDKLKASKGDTVAIAQSTSEMDKIPRTSLLLSPIQLLREDYPLPFDTSRTYDGYIHSKDEYVPVTNQSPLFAIDCEMCYNCDGEMEIVWFAMVNESGESVFETYIRPAKKILNYLTNITGVSSKTIENVQVTLQDLQLKLREILPGDAIICGQSLNNDLHSLKMFHPYVIDTSVIFNLTGSRDIKPSLKQLSGQFLGKIIQEGAHNPLIDARCSLNLVLLKLRHGIQFGDVIINGCTDAFGSQQLEMNICLDDQMSDLSDPAKLSKFIYQSGINIDQSFENVLKTHSITNIRRTCKSLEETELDSVLKAQQTDAQFKWFEFELGQEENGTDINKLETKKLLKFIRKMYNEHLKDDSMLIVVFTGASVPIEDNLNEDGIRFAEKDLLNGRCFIKLKNLELEKLESEVKVLYEQVKLNSK